MGSWAERTCGKVAAGGPGRKGSSWQTRQGGGLWTGWSHICMQINQEEQLGSETDHETQGSSIEE